MADEDDLPPKQLSEPPEETESGARSFGELFGGGMFLFAFIAVAGIVLYLVLRAIH